MKRSLLPKPTLEQVRAWQRKPRKPIPRISAKGKKLKSEMGRLGKAFLKSHPRCVIFPHLKSTVIHHRRGRIGKNLLDQSTWMAVSREGHDTIHSNTGWAYMKGYMVNRDSKALPAMKSTPIESQNLFLEAHRAAQLEQP